MAKNAGKTITLNYIIQEAMDKGIRLGLTSTGRDGEREDLVTNTEKPPIYAPEGTLVATASRCLDMGDAKVEIIDVTKYTTSLGPIVIGKIKDSGYIQIAGPNTSTEIKEICDLMLGLGTELVIIDGAIDRKSSASPVISDGTILATGAVISRDMNRVIEETVHTIELFGLPEIRGIKERSVIEKVFTEDKIAIIDKDYNTNYLNVRTALNSGELIGTNIDETTLYIVFSGALVNKTVEDIIRIRRINKDINLVVRDGTRIFIDANNWQRFKRLGIRVNVLNRIKTLAVTVNPYSPQGYYFEPEEFVLNMRKYISNVPVYDVVLGGE